MTQYLRRTGEFPPSRKPSQVHGKMRAGLGAAHDRAMTKNRMRNAGEPIGGGEENLSAGELTNERLRIVAAPIYTTALASTLNRSWIFSLASTSTVTLPPLARRPNSNSSAKALRMVS